MILPTCKECKLHKFRKNIIYGKGSLPADILFIIDTPSKIDDLHGKIFLGLYGKFVDKMIYDALILSESKKDPSMYFTSLVGCRACDREGGETREPKKIEIESCLFRIQDIKLKINPKVTVFFGKLVTKHLKKIFQNYFEVTHPQILLNGGGLVHPDYGITVRKLSEAFIYLQTEKGI